jgi:hypothetical protein
MLRLLLGTGVLLMAVGFGAAGWQYWQSLPQASPAVADETAPADAVQPAPAQGKARQGWLISPSGGLIAQDDVRNYLAQERFAEGRTVSMRLQANLSDLLAQGEKLPEVEYLQVLADIRAPKVAEGMCAVLLQYFAADCAVNAARVVENTVDPVAGTAQFRLEMVYRLPDPAEDLPDLAARVLRIETALMALDDGRAGTETAEAALGAALAAVTEACATEAVGQACRPMRLSVEWTPGTSVMSRAAIAWLDPLPKGMFTAPPLTPVSGE